MLLQRCRKRSWAVLRVEEVGLPGGGGMMVAVVIVVVLIHKILKLL